MGFQEAFENLNFIAILVAALSAFFIGGIWYSLLFGKLWMKLHGFTDEQLKKTAGKVFGGSFVLALIISFFLAMFIGPDSSGAFGLIAGFMAGAFFVAAALGITYLFERRPLVLFLLDGGYHIVTFSVMGFILGVWS
ncbi:hypothetical protein JOC95_002792 [Bacillus tianshenii]|uniref:DUF1761 domain-containing protein n=1 Tax=Sutcliffiella tianshenii TaxID=1463404 RepID=A0ABS2P1V2_9BACI|nr:DUF1761 domain-containing protein [Bacillus tianshenii]MBM7620937.1 hypothetical protein [Bacillus tianshenii]MCA1321415.1 DUF1761 domain-containing protein [Bacillus tianshenii]